MDELSLPRAEDAVIPEDKLRDYALNPEHPTGRHKARVFASALGISRDDWRYLRDEIAGKLPTARVSAVRESPYGFLYDLPMLLEGRNGATEEVITAWFVSKHQAAPRLVSAYVNTP